MRRTHYLLMMDNNYKKAIEILDKKRRPLRPIVESSHNVPGLNHIPNLSGKSELKGSPSISGMKEWLLELGHSVADVNRLNIIHVAGTKGKGSTCAFIDSFLRAHGQRIGYPRKVGLYTGPHLIHPEERIRINFEPLRRDLFAKYFFEVDKILSQEDGRRFDSRPRYLQLFALLGIHTFIREGVDVAIFETHHGGEYDSTNVFEKPMVTAITTLGLDHMKQLGSTIESIAWHKSGIFKSGATALSAPQEAEAAEVLRKRASDLDVSLQIIDEDPSLDEHSIQLTPAVQRTNCSVALAVVHSFLDQKADSGSSLSAEDIIQGVQQFSWPGRFQTIVHDKFQWFLDGAHNEMSVTIAADWFLETAEIRKHKSPVTRILVFSLITDQRDGAAVFEQLTNSLTGSGINAVIFTTYERVQGADLQHDPQSEMSKSMHAEQYVYAEIWRKSHPHSFIYFEPTIQGALDAVRNVGKDYGSIQTLITGSQHLVGGALYLLQDSKM